MKKILLAALSLLTLQTANGNELCSTLSAYAQDVMLYRQFFPEESLEDYVTQTDLFELEALRGAAIVIASKAKLTPVYTLVDQKISISVKYSQFINISCRTQFETPVI